MAQKGQQRLFHQLGREMLRDVEACDLEKPQTMTRKRFQTIGMLLAATDVSQKTIILKRCKCRVAQEDAVTAVGRKSGYDADGARHRGL